MNVCMVIIYVVQIRLMDDVFEVNLLIERQIPIQYHLLVVVEMA